MARKKATRRKTTRKKSTRRKSTTRRAPRRASRTARKKPMAMKKLILGLGLLSILVGAFTSFLTIEWGIIIAIVLWLIVGLKK